MKPLNRKTKWSYAVDVRHQKHRWTAVCIWLPFYDWYMRRKMDNALREFTGKTQHQALLKTPTTVLTANKIYWFFVILVLTLRAPILQPIIVTFAFENSVTAFVESFFVKILRRWHCWRKLPQRCCSSCIWFIRDANWGIHWNKKKWTYWTEEFLSVTRCPIKCREKFLKSALNIWNPPIVFCQEFQFITKRKNIFRFRKLKQKFWNRQH